MGAPPSEVLSSAVRSRRPPASSGKCKANAQRQGDPGDQARLASGRKAFPAESVAGVTSGPGVTPPPTSSGNGSNDGAPQTFALLICAALGIVGLLAVRTQRRAVRR